MAVIAGIIFAKSASIYGIRNLAINFFIYMSLPFFLDRQPAKARVIKPFEHAQQYVS
jgi:hypothetical protein